MKKSVITEVKQSSRSGPREWKTMCVVMVRTSKKNRVRIVIAILNEEVTKFALVFFGRGRRNSFYITSHISPGNLATEVCMGSIDTEWTTEHTCFDGILIECIVCLCKALTGFHWDNPCRTHCYTAVGLLCQIVVNISREARMWVLSVRSSIIPGELGATSFNKYALWSRCSISGWHTL